MTNEELSWLHRIEARMEIEGLESGRRMLSRLNRSNRFINQHQQMMEKARQRYLEFNAIERRAA
jgi:hypothetical protein